MFLKEKFLSFLNPFLAIVKKKLNSLSPVATSGEYTDLKNLPNLDLYKLASELHAVASSGEYADLEGKPNLLNYALVSQLANVATTGKFNDLVDKPNMSLYVLRTVLSLVALSGEYADLKNKPDLSLFALISNLHAVATSGEYAELKNKPNLDLYKLASELHLIATSGEYADLKNRPDLSVYALIENLHSIATSGEYAELKNKPDLSVFALVSNLHAIATSGNYNELINKPDLSIFIENSKIGIADGLAPLDNTGKIPSQFLNLSALNPKGSWNASNNTPTLINGTGNNGDFYLVNTSGSVNLGAGIESYSEGDALVYFTSTNTWERIGRPDSVSSVNGKQGAIILNTDDIQEGTTNKYYTASKVQADQIQPDWNAIEGKGKILNRPNLSPVATSGDYNELSNKPNLTTKADKATTLQGYGILDALSNNEAVNMAQAGKILRLNSQAELPAVSSATYKLKTARKIKITGKVIGEVDFDGSGDVEISANNDKLIEKTNDGKYPALDGSLIQNIVPLIPEFSEDPVGLANGQMYVINTILFPEGEYQGVGMIGWSEELNQLRIKLSNGTKQIKLEQIF
jgi:hypothetical protein